MQERWPAGCWVPKQPRKKLCLLWNAIKLHGERQTHSCWLENSDRSSSPLWNFQSQFLLPVSFITYRPFTVIRYKKYCCPVPFIYPVQKFLNEKNSKKLFLHIWVTANRFLLTLGLPGSLSELGWGCGRGRYCWKKKISCYWRVSDNWTSSDWSVHVSVQVLQEKET